MRRPGKLLLAATLLCGTAMSTAYAQTDQAGVQENATCDRLEQLAQDNRERFQREWITRAEEVARVGNNDECAPYVQQAERAVEQLEGQGSTQQAAGGDDADGSRIIVTQPEPRVTVEQDAPEIAVTQPQPTVNVQQAQPQIIVRQAQPTVTVQMPQPTITIDQPQPEIIVRMPEPEVAVRMQEPQVSVEQAQPQVRVEQAQPQVNVEMEQPDVNVREQQEAEVQVERGQPIVRLQEAEQAQVSVDQAQPQVSYESAEPKVEFESAGEPQVRFSQSGEANIRYERLSDQEQQNAAATEPRADAQQTASVEGENERYERLRMDENLASTTTQPRGYLVSSIVGRDVENGRGEELGSIERVILSGERAYAVLAHGGFLGLGEREVALPLDSMILRDGEEEIIMRGMTEEDIEAMPRFDASAGEELADDQEVELGTL